VPARDTIAQLVAWIGAHPRGLVVAGWGAAACVDTVNAFAAAAGWPVLADPISQLRAGPHAVSTYEALLRAEAFTARHAADVVLRLGAPLTSKVANAWLDSIDTLLVDPDDSRLDPACSTARRIVCDADELLTALTKELAAPQSNGWLADWMRIERAARRALDDVLDDAVLCEARIARDVAAAVPSGAPLVVASSLPVRALEWAMAPRRDLRVMANRGVNGIDGFVSTALGVARGAGTSTVALTGDLGFLHDVNGLLSADGATPVTFVVVDNGGGGIFSYLPQRDLPELERFFTAPQPARVLNVARAYGIPAEPVDDCEHLAKLVAEDADHCRVLVVGVSPAASADQHRRGWEAVATASS
jgi:2-succinyl-5-enolpyruvyl-6-hydroxy-3-cyclohexene-1-carboxylate synthase